MKLAELFEAPHEVVKKLPSFKLVKTNRGGGRVSTTPLMTCAQLTSIFGKPQTNLDDDKVSTMWVITFADGTDASIYDYKATSKYSKSLPSPEEFRKTPHDWSIGGNIRSGKPALLVLATIMKHFSNDEVIKVILTAHKHSHEDRGYTETPGANTLIGAARLAGKDLPEFAAIEKSIDATIHEARNLVKGVWSAKPLKLLNRYSQKDLSKALKSTPSAQTVTIKNAQTGEIVGKRTIFQK